VAVSPFSAEHPVGSGTVVRYQPGERFPGEEWGMAAHNLVEMGKAVRLAVNVPELGGTILSPPVEPAVAPSAVEVSLESYMGEFPVQGGGGWWMLSDGSRVRGEVAARDGQRLLDEENE